MSISSRKRLASLSQTLITGVYRSGTEFVTHCLDSHPELSATMYRVNVLRFALGRFDPIHERENYVGAVHGLAQRIRERYALELDVGVVIQALDEASAVDYCALYDAVMTTMYLDDRVRHWAEKVQLVWREIPYFLERMPRGKALMVIRDPRSVLASFKRFTYAPPPAYLGAVFNCLDAMQKALEYSENYPESFFWVRYEDAVQRPEETTRSIWRFLGLDPGFPLTPQGRWLDSYGRPWNSNTCFQNPENRGDCFDTQAALERKSLLNREERSLTEAVCGPLMQRFGYKLTDDVPDWLAVFRLFAADDVISGYFRNWIVSGVGVQAFPTDPLKRENWRKRGREEFRESH